MHQLDFLDNPSRQSFAFRLLQICPDGFHAPLDYTVTRWKQVRRAVASNLQYGHCK